MSPMPGLITGSVNPVAYSAGYSGTPIYSVLFNAYDKLGRITQKTETIGVATDVYDYGYDLAGRLETVKKNTVADFNLHL